MAFSDPGQQGPGDCRGPHRRKGGCPGPVSASPTCPLMRATAARWRPVSGSACRSRKVSSLLMWSPAGRRPSAGLAPRRCGGRDQPAKSLYGNGLPRLGPAGWRPGPPGYPAGRPAAGGRDHRRGVAKILKKSFLEAGRSPPLLYWYVPGMAGTKDLKE